MSKDYPLKLDGNIHNLDENDSLTKMFRLVGDDKRVIDFGCSSGTLAKLLTTRGCRVTGIEINPSAAEFAKEYCEKVIVADLDFVSLTSILADEKFDVAVLGDVLEHLRNPWQILKDITNFLNPGGFVVASIPNVAHGAVRLALLQGRFEYEELGLLDNTHLRFFTRQTVKELLEKSGYVIDVLETTKIPIFSGMWIPKVSQEDFSNELTAIIESQPDSDTLQFVLRAFPKSSEDDLHKVQLISESSKFHFTKSQGEIERLQSLVNNLQAQATELNNKIIAMESSKFWQLRRQWFKIKRLFGFPEN